MREHIHMQVQKLVWLLQKLLQLKLQFLLYCITFSKSKRNYENSDYQRYLLELELIPEKVQEALQTNDVAKTNC
jgi:hypothetical protein